MSTDPLALEIQSLKAALEKYQHASHTSSLQLQRAHLNSTETSARSKFLEAENARLKHEISFLRANPDTTPTSFQASELTLALRRSSEKLDLTEGILLQRTTELAHALSEKARMQLEAKPLLTELDGARQREEESRSRERELERKCKAAQEEARMADVVVMEYADLIRTLEVRRSKAANLVNPANGNPEDTNGSNDSPAPSPTENGDARSYLRTRSDNLVQSLTENRFSLQRLLHEFNTETSNLQTEITRLHNELSSAQATLDTERENSKLDRIKLAEALVEVDRHKTDDGAAGKIVSRYMQFSQSSINMLQAALSGLKSRHAATLATMSSSSEALSQSLALERKRAYQLRDALDQLAEDISRESFGRRREIALRLHGIVREEKTVEALEAWLRRAEEGRSKVARPAPNMDVTQGIVDQDKDVVLNRMIEGAQGLLATLASEEGSVYNIEGNSSLSRVVLAQEMVRSLTTDLRKETEKRMALTRNMAKELSAVHMSSEPARDEKGLHLPSSDMSSPPEEIRFPTGAVSDTNPSSLTQSNGAAPGTIGEVLNQDETARSHSSSSEQLDEVATVARSPSAKKEHTISEVPPQISLEPQESIGRRHPLLGELRRAFHRYDELQRAYRDCHLTLVKLKADIAPISTYTGIPVAYNVIDRLDDFCEDTRVELEIRIADEERISQGFETLLGVPGVLADDKEKQRVEYELHEFLDGTSPSIAKAYEVSTSKLDDLQHDIAQVKRALHESFEEASGAHAQSVPTTPPPWSSWTPPFLSGANSRPSSPAPTFGTVITTPRSRRVSSIGFFSQSPVRVSSDGTLNTGDPYAHLGLRIPMPSQAPSVPSPSARLRKTSSSSGMYLLGLGSRSGFFSKQEVIAEVQAPRSELSRGSEDDSDTQKSQSDVDDVQ